MALARTPGSPRIRAELRDLDLRMVALMVQAGDKKAAAITRERIRKLEAGEEVTGLMGWEVDRNPHFSYPWTLGADDRVRYDGTEEAMREAERLSGGV